MQSLIISIYNIYIYSIIFSFFLFNLMAVRQFQFNFSRDRLVFLFRTSQSHSHSFFRNNKSPQSLISFSPSSFLRRLAASAATPSPPPIHLRRPRPPPPDNMAQKFGKSTRRPGASSKARVYADINVVRPKEYWDYETLTVQWG